MLTVIELQQPETLREFVEDVDELLGLSGKFWDSLETDRMKIETPEQVTELARDTLTELFGLSVRGL